MSRIFDKRKLKLPLHCTQGRSAVRSFAECGKIMGISKARCQQLETRALWKLRQHPLMQRLAAEAGLIPEPDT